MITQVCVLLLEDNSSAPLMMGEVTESWRQTCAEQFPGHVLAGPFTFPVGDPDVRHLLETMSEGDPNEVVPLPDDQLLNMALMMFIFGWNCRVKCGHKVPMKQKQITLSVEGLKEKGRNDRLPSKMQLFSGMLSAMLSVKANALHRKDLRLEMIHQFQLAFLQAGKVKWA